MKIAPRRDYMVGLESVVMTDIIMNMFIFFFISFSLLYTFSKSAGIKVTLPTAKTSAPQKEHVTVFVNKENEIFFDNKKVGIDELRDALKEKFDTGSDKILILKSDENVNLGLAVKVMDTAKEAKAEGVVISTTTEDDVGR